jgi:transaldolase
VTSSRLFGLHALGQSVWLNDLSRPLIQSGELTWLISNRAVTGVTTNPTILQTALASNSCYRDALKQQFSSQADPYECFLRMVVPDVVDACDILRPVWERSQHDDGHVSVEVRPTLAHTVQETVEDALGLAKRISRPNVLIKVPGTPAGFTATEELIERGVSVNVTLLFNEQQCAAAQNAYLNGLERLLDRGGDPSTVRSVASLFVARTDVEVERRLAGLGLQLDLPETAAVSIARRVFLNSRALACTARWQRLADAGARPQRCLWASTWSKDPRYPDTRYVEALALPETINTMGRDTLDAFHERGVVPDLLRVDVETSEMSLRILERAGIDIADVTATTARVSLAGFEASFIATLEELARNPSATQSVASPP